MKRILISLVALVAMVSMVTVSFAGTSATPYSFLAPGVTYIQLAGGANGQGLTNLQSFQKFVGANGSFVQPTITNVGILYTNTRADPANGYLIVATNITATPVQTIVTPSITNVYGTGLSNAFVGFTTLIGPVQAGVHAVTNGIFNLLSQVSVPGDGFQSRQYWPGGNNTNSWGTLQFTTIADGTNVCIFTFVALPDGINEDTDTKGTFSVSVTNALGIRTSETPLPVFMPGIQKIRLQSITSTGGGVASKANQVGILGVNLITDTP